MPVYKLMNEMPYDEFIRWAAYFEQRPLDWRDDLRTGYLLKAQGDKRPLTEIFPSLSSIFRPAKSNNPTDSLKSSLIFSKMLSAKNGDKPQFLKEL